MPSKARTVAGKGGGEGSLSHYVTPGLSYDQKGERKKKKGKEKKRESEQTNKNSPRANYIPPVHSQKLFVQRARVYLVYMCISPLHSFTSYEHAAQWASLRYCGAASTAPARHAQQSKPLQKGEGCTRCHAWP